MTRHFDSTTRDGLQIHTRIDLDLYAAVCAEKGVAPSLFERLEITWPMPAPEPEPTWRDRISDMLGRGATAQAA